MNTLALCDVIVSNIEANATKQREITLRLCESLAVLVENEAVKKAFSRTFLGNLIKQGVKVRFEGVTLHDG